MADFSTWNNMADTGNLATAMAPKAPAKSGGKKSWITSLIPAAASILGGIGGTFVAPGAGTAVGGAAGGAIGKKIQDLVTGQHSGLGSYLGEAALGSLGGLGKAAEAVRGASAAEGGAEALNALRFGSKGASAVNDVEKAASTASNLSTAKKALTANAANQSGSSNIVSKTGTELRKDVINPKVPAGVGGAQKEAQIAAEASKVPGLSASSKYKNLQGSVNELTNKINPILEKSKGTTDTSKLLSSIRTNAEASPHFLAGDATHETQLGKVLTDLGAKTGGADKLTAKQLFDYKQGMDMNSVFTKLQKGADLNPKEASRLAVWSSLDKAITNAEPAVKELTTQQSRLIQSATGLKANSVKTAGVPILGIKSQKAEQAIQSAKELTGKVLGKAGSTTTEVPTTVSGLVGRTAKNMIKAQVIPRVATGEVIPQNPQDNIDATQTNTLPTETPTPEVPVSDNEKLQQGLKIAAIQALQSGDKEALANISAVSSLLQSMDKTSSTKLSTTQQARSDALQTALVSLDSAGSNLESAGGAQGPKGELAKLPVVGKYIDPQAAAYHDTKIELATQLAKAITGGSRPAQSVVDKYLHSLPDVNDPPEYAQAKIDKLKNELITQAKSFGFKDLLSQYGGA